MERPRAAVARKRAPGAARAGRISPPPVRRTRIVATARRPSAASVPRLRRRSRGQLRSGAATDVRRAQPNLGSPNKGTEGTVKLSVPPRMHLRYGSGGSRAEALRPRRGGWRDAVHSFAHPCHGAADFGRRPTGGGAGVKGAQPPAPFFGYFLWRKESIPPAGAGPGNYTAHRAVSLRRPQPAGSRQAAPLIER